MEEIEVELPCAEKLRFETKVLAEGAAVAAAWQYGTSLKSYKCHYCQLWHLAST